MKKIAIFVSMIVLLSTLNAEVIKSEDKAYYADFVKFLEVSGAKESQKTILKSMFNQFKSMPNVNPKAFDDMEKMMNDELEALNKSLFPVYKKYLTPADLKGIIAFYQSPAGKNLTKYQPMIIKDSFAIGSKWGRSVAERVLAKAKAVK